MYIDKATRQYYATEQELKNVFGLESKDSVEPFMNEMGVFPLKWYGEETVYPFQEVYENYAEPKGIPRRNFFISVQGYVPYTEQERNMNKEIKRMSERVGKAGRQLHYHRLMTGSYEALFFMFGQFISKEDKEITMRMLQGEAPEDLGEEKDMSTSFVVHSCERAINEIHYYCSLIRNNRAVMGSLLHIIEEVVRKEEEKVEKEICNGILRTKEPLGSKKKDANDRQGFTYPTDGEYREDELWTEADRSEYAGDSGTPKREKE